MLIVDDVPENVALTRAVLGSTHCDLFSAASGNDALSLLGQHDFALMFIDVQMPGMDGFELAMHVRANLMTRDVAIVFLTAEDPNSDAAARAYALGAIDFLYKPIDRNALRGKTLAILELYNQRQEILDIRDALERSNAELRAAYRQLSTTQQQLIQSAKMASMGTFVAGIAHEINSPLAFVIAHLTTIERMWKASVSDQSTLVEERFRAVQTGLERIRTLIWELQTFARVDPVEHKPIHVRESISAVLNLLDARLARTIDVDIRCGTPEHILCSPQLLSQGVFNLVANAVDALDGEGKITIACAAEGNDYVIRVSDTGCGIPPSIRDRVLDPFFTTKPVGSGTGLGLAVTHALVLAHGGTLDLLELPRGTEAVISIPLRNVGQ